jgi:hypothetical protein
MTATEYDAGNDSLESLDNAINQSSHSTHTNKTNLSTGTTTHTTTTLMTNNLLYTVTCSSTSTSMYIFPFFSNLI